MSGDVPTVPPRLPPLPLQASLVYPHSWSTERPTAGGVPFPPSSLTASTSREAPNSASPPQRPPELPLDPSVAGESSKASSRAAGAAPSASTSTARRRTQSQTRGNSRTPIPVHASANSPELIIFPPPRTHSRSVSTGVVLRPLPSNPRDVPKTLKHPVPPPLPSLDHVSAHRNADASATVTPASTFAAGKPMSATVSVTTVTSIATSTPTMPITPHSAPPRHLVHHTSGPSPRQIVDSTSPPSTTPAPIASPTPLSPPHSAPAVPRRSKEDQEREREEWKEKEKTRLKERARREKEKARPVLVVCNPDQAFLDMGAGAPDASPPAIIRAPTPPRAGLRRADSSRVRNQSTERPTESARAQPSLPPPVPVPTRKESRDGMDTLGPNAGTRGPERRQDTTRAPSQETATPGAREKSRPSQSSRVRRQEGSESSSNSSSRGAATPSRDSPRARGAPVSPSPPPTRPVLVPGPAKERGRAAQVPAPLRATPENSAPAPEPDANQRLAPNAYAHKWVLEKKGRRVTQDSMVVVQQLRMLR